MDKCFGDALLLVVRLSNLPQQSPHVLDGRRAGDWGRYDAFRNLGSSGTGHPSQGNPASCLVFAVSRGTLRVVGAGGAPGCF
jgi:hypothetical protein